MKKLAGLIIILAVLILGGYYGMGMITERTIKKDISVINQTNGLFADIQHYNRGWFSSHALIKWRVHIPERIVTDANGASQTIAAQDYQIEMPLDIHHGPMMIVDHKVRFGMGYAETVFRFPEKYKPQFDEQFTADSIKPQLDLSIFVNYVGKSIVELSVPSFKLISKVDQGVFEWKGLESATTLAPKMDKVEGHIDVEGATFSKADAQVVLGNVNTEYELHQTSAGILLGDASFNLPSLEVMDKAQRIFSLKDFTLTSNSDIKDNLFSTHLNLALDSAFANDKNYGPGEFELTLRNLDADVLAKINQQSNIMQNGTEAERQQAMLTLLPELPKLFNKGAELELSKGSFKIPEGIIEASMLVSLPKSENTNPLEMLQKLQGNARLKVPMLLVKQLAKQSVLQQMAKQPEMQQALLQQLQTDSNQATQPALTTDQLATMQSDRQIATMEQNGLIVTSGSDYVVEVTLEQGKFTVNGKPFDPAMLKF